MEQKNVLSPFFVIQAKHRPDWPLGHFSMVKSLILKILS